MADSPETGWIVAALSLVGNAVQGWIGYRGARELERIRAASPTLQDVISALEVAKSERNEARTERDDARAELEELRRVVERLTRRMRVLEEILGLDRLEDRL